MLNLVVSSPTDRIQRGGGSVVVSSVGAVIFKTPTSGAAVTPIAGEMAYYDDSASVRSVLRSGRSRFDLLDAPGTNYSSLYAGAATFNNTLTVSGPGPHPFSGPVAITTTNAAPLLVDHTTASAFAAQRVKRSGAVRYDVLVSDVTDDVLIRTVTGAAGSEVYTEALRIVNANGYVSVATRLGVGTASPSTALHVVGTFTQTGPISAWVTSTAQTPAKFEQTAASATVPVVVVKLGATPGAGGDALQVQSDGGSVLTYIDKNGAVIAPFVNVVNTSAALVPFWIKGAAAQTADLFQAQDSGGNVQMLVNNNGNLILKGTAGTSGATVDVLARAAAPSAPGAGYARLWYDDTAKRLKYIDSVGTTLTLTAA